MNNDEMNKKMEFIVEHQARFAAEIEILREQDQKLTDAIIGTVDIIGSLARVQTRAEENVNSLADTVDKLAKSHQRADERLNSLINVVERFISGNGGAENRA